MADVCDIAAAVAADSVLSGWSPVVAFAPEVELKDLKFKKCYVVPTGTDNKPVSRSQIELTHHVDVGLMFRDRNMNIQSLIGVARTVALSFLRKKFCGVLCVESAYNPMYDSDGLREKNQFTAVVSLTFKEVIDG